MKTIHLSRRIPGVVALLLSGAGLAGCGGGGGSGSGGPQADTSPDPVAFAKPVVEKMTPGLTLDSSPVVVKGVDTGAVIPAVVEGGLIGINGGAEFTAGPVNVTLDDHIVLRATAPDAFESSRTARLTLGEGAGAQVAEFTLKTGASTFTVVPGFKSLTFKWGEMIGASHFELYENADGASGFSKLEIPIPGDATEATLSDIPVHLTDWNNARYQLQACNASGCVSVPQHETQLNPRDSLAGIGFLKASNVGENDQFGIAVALSGDELTLAVGARYEESPGSDEPDSDAVLGAGAVYIYRRPSKSRPWQFSGMLKAVTPQDGDQFGTSIALDFTGHTLAVGAPYERSTGTGVSMVVDDSGHDGNKDGAVYLYDLRFENDELVATPVAFFKGGDHVNATGDGVSAGDKFGGNVALNDEGDLLIVAADSEDSAATGINPSGGELNNEVLNAGAVFVYRKEASGEWIKEAYLKASSTDSFDQFGFAISIDKAGRWLAVGAPLEDSDASDLDGDPLNNDAANRGAVYLFERDVSGTSPEWRLVHYIKPVDGFPDQVTRFGASVSLDSAGRMLAIGVPSPGASGVEPGSGAVEVLIRELEASTWEYAAVIQPEVRGAGDAFGEEVKLSADGKVLIVSATGEDGAASGIVGAPPDGNHQDTGALYVFVGSSETSVWRQQNVLKLPFADFKEMRELSVNTMNQKMAVTASGNEMYVGNPLNDTATSDPEDRCGSGEPANCKKMSGAVVIY